MITCSEFSPVADPEEEPGRPAPTPPPLNLRPKGGPKSRKNFFRDRPPPPHILSQGLDDYPRLTYLKVRIRH